MPIVRLVSLEDEKSAVFLTQSRSPVPVELDLRVEPTVNIAIEHSPVRLSLPELSDSVKNMPCAASLFCELYSEDTIGRSFHLVLSSTPAHQPENVMFLTSAESFEVVSRFNKIADQYLVQGSKLPAAERLIIDFLQVSAEAKLNTLIFSDLRFRGYE